MTDDEIRETATKLYQWKHKSGGWFISGYKCRYCGKHYASLRKEFYSHTRNCTGPKTNKSLED